jgi:hypothetical protein
VNHENGAILSVVQAFVGLARPEIRGVAVSATQDRVDVYFAVDNASDAVREDLDDDFLVELSALYPLSTELFCHVFEGDPWGGAWEGRSHRVMYLQQRPESGQ